MKMTNENKRQNYTRIEQYKCVYPFEKQSKVMISESERTRMKVTSPKGKVF